MHAFIEGKFVEKDVGLNVMGGSRSPKTTVIDPFC